MKPGIPPPPPDDDASDPLLAALRQRLGDYGQAPPPAAWAAIRQHLPPAPVRPWWRQPQRILPLLALLFGLVTIGLLTQRRGQLAGSAQQRSYRQPRAHSLAGRPLARVRAANTGNFAASDSLSVAASQPTTKTLLPATAATAPLTTTAAPQREATLPISLSKQPTLAEKGFLGQVSSAEKRSSPARKSAYHATHFSDIDAASEEAAGVAFIAKNHRRAREHAAFKAAPATGRKREPSRYLGSRSATTASGRHAVSAVLSAGAVATTPAATIAKKPAYLTYAAPQKRRTTQAYVHPPALATTAAHATRRGQHAQAGPPAPPAIAAAGLATRPYPAPAPTAAGAAVDSLVLARPVLAVAAGTLPPSLRAATDSVRTVAPVRRWSVLLVAGPTLSYRTLGPAPTLAAGQPDFARLERPALGFGAQVQVRRVLSGRWAVAVGLGYHEYATRLALSLKDSAYASVHQRDTYWLLTVPVQLSYALGVPRGHLSWALLAGLELGWYQGGRSTEGSTCSCQQQVYSATAPRPYRSLSLAFSLGLDLRYRLGGPASHWHLVVQPTGRYVATPFVRSDAVGFTQRQPFSLGLLTGFSWDVH